MKMNGGQWRKWEKCFRLAFPQNLYNSGNIWPGLTSRHLLLGEKHGEPPHPPSSNNNGGLMMHSLIGVNGGLDKMGKVFWLPFPQNLTKSGNIRPGLTSRHSLQEEKTQISYTSPSPPKNKVGTDRCHWMGVNAGLLGTSHDCQKLFSFFWAFCLKLGRPIADSFENIWQKNPLEPLIYFWKYSMSKSDSSSRWTAMCGDFY